MLTSITLCVKSHFAAAFSLMVDIRDVRRDSVVIRKHLEFVGLDQNTGSRCRGNTACFHSVVNILMPTVSVRLC